MQISQKEDKQRYYLIDALRGFSVLNMVVFHFLYDIFEIYGLNSGWYFHPLSVVWERFICVSFIVISGVSFNFSRRAYRRGIIVNLCGFVVTAVTTLVMPQQAVWFGILNFIGCTMLICQALREYLERVQPFVGIALSLVIFALTYGIPQRYMGVFAFRLFELPDWLYGFKYAAFLGFPSADFVSTDFFPLIPWIFLFLAGYFFWRCVKKVKFDDVFRVRVPMLGFIGRYSLWIYLAHQPLLIGICMIIFGF